MKTTNTAQYAAVAANTSCLLAVVNTEIAVAKMRAKINVIIAISFADTLQVRNKYIGINNKAVDATAITTLISIPSRCSE
jgi:hypothetical protein